MSDLHAGGARMTVLGNRFRKIIRRSIIGYFAPVIAACRLSGRPGRGYVHQLRVVYRYAFWK